MQRSPRTPHAGEDGRTTDGAGRVAVAVRPGAARTGRSRQRVSRALFPADQTAAPGWVLALPIAVGAVSVVLLALTSPFGLLLAPLAAVRVIALGRDRGVTIPLAFLAGAAVQAVDMAIVGGRQTSHAFLPGVTERLYTAFVAGQGLFGVRYSLPWQPLGRAAVIALLAALVLVAASGMLRAAGLAALAMAYSAVYFTVLMMLTYGVDHGYGLRYNLGPFLLLAYAVTVLLDAGLPGASRWTGHIRAGRRHLAALPRLAALILCAVLAGSLAWSVTTAWNLREPRRQHPTWSGALAGARAECGRGARTVQVPIAPASTRQHWHVTLTCAQLGPR